MARPRTASRWPWRRLGQQATKLSETLGAKLLPEWEAAAAEVQAAPGELGAWLGAGGCASQAGWATDAQPASPSC